MGKQSNQKLKLLYILEYLNYYSDEDHKAETGDIIKYLKLKGISSERKSIYSDIEALSLFDCDINTERNKSNCYWIGERKFQLPELKLLVDAVQSCKFITAKKSEQLIKKLVSLTSIHNSKQLHRQVVSVNRIKSMNESVYINIDTINKAIADNKKIEFKYSEWKISNSGTVNTFRKNGREYIISPWSLLWANENYYVISYYPEHKGISHFRVDRMKNINIREENREGQNEFTDFDVGKYYKKTFEMFSGEYAFVDLKLKNNLIGVIIDRFGDNTVIRKIDDKYFEVTVEVIPSCKFYSWVYSFGTDIKICSPQKVIDGFVKYSQNVISLYK